MMGVYIKGIKTPAIVKVHYLNGRRYVEDPQSGEWREMVDIPPHVRLGDLDALTESLRKILDDPNCPLFVAATVDQIVDCAPTVIPADPPKEET